MSLKKIFLIFYIVVSIFFLWYISLPGFGFPDPPADSYTSVEPGDSEAMDIRRAYFTNYTREEVQQHYKNQFLLPSPFSWIITRLTYPPEEAYSLIRDQTRSTHLVELTHPFRESIFINEFVAKEAKDDIWYKGVHYNQKITVRIVPSNLYARLFVSLLTLVVGYFVAFELWLSFGDTVKNIIKLPSKIIKWFKRSI